MLNRREALKLQAAIGLGLYLPATAVCARGEDSPNEKVDIACIGLGGQGGHQLNGLQKQNLVALVDCDEERAGNAFQRFPNAKKFTDFRRLFDEYSEKFDAFTVSTPDHTHFHPAFIGMSLKKHLYLEKPMSRTVKECRILTELARTNKLATQLGVQRHSGNGMRRVVELVRAGAIGKITEVYTWMDGNRGMPEPPKEFPPVPATLDWDLWLGPAKERAYSPEYCPYKWRFWWDFGTGETGNFGCHILDVPFWALDLAHCEWCAADGPEIDAQRTPKSMQVTYKFPARKSWDGKTDLAPVTMHWSHGRPVEILKKYGLDKQKGGNNLFIGEKGLMFCDYQWARLFPEEQFKDYQTPEQSIAPSPGFHNEWINAIKGGVPATCCFDYSGPLAETVILGNCAYRAGAKEGFIWDWQNVKSPDNTAINEYIYPKYRKGWEL